MAETAHCQHPPGLIEPAASLPEVAIHSGRRVIKVNPNPTPLSRRASYVLSGPAGVMLPALVQAVWPAPTTL